MKWICLAVFSTALTLTACDNHQSQETLDSKQSPALDEMVQKKIQPGELDETGIPADSVISPPPQQGDKKVSAPPVATIQTDWDKKIMKTAFVNLEVKEFKKYSTGLRESIKMLGGYFAQEEQNQSDYKIESTVMIKVPVASFDDAVTLATGNVGHINEKKITSQDVTGEIVDTRSRIEAKKQVRLRYLDLLKQAKNMEEILTVQSSINGVQEEIETATGRVGYLGHSAAYSTINLTFYQVLNAAKQEQQQQTPSFGNKIFLAFRSGLSWLADLLVGLIYLWPLFLLCFFLVIGYKRMRPRKTNVP